MGKSAKFFKRPTRKEKAVLSLTKGPAETSLFDAVSNGGRKGTTKDILSATANHTISKKSSAPSGALAHPPKASLAYKMQLNGGVKMAVKDMETLDEAELASEDEDMEDEDDTTANGSSSRSSGSKAQQSSKSKGLDKTQPRPDYVELMYGKPQSGNKRKTFTPKPALIK